MRRRGDFPGLVLLTTVWAWLVFVVACGAVASRYEKQLANLPADECCAHAPTNDPCETPSCGLACAALFTVALSEDRVTLVPEMITRAFLSRDEVGAAISRRPPVPPPKTWGVT